MRLTLKVSSVAFSAVVVVVATGVFQSIRQVGSFYALFHTVYGRTLLVKIGLVVVLIAFGGLSRRILHAASGHRFRAIFPALGPQVVDARPSTDTRPAPERGAEIGAVSPTVADPAHRTSTAVADRVDPGVRRPLSRSNGSVARCWPRSPLPSPSWP